MTQTPRRTSRVPGFPDPDRAVRPLPSKPGTSQLTPPQSEDIPGIRHLSVRLPAAMLERHKRLLRDLANDGYEATLTESIQAILFHAPTDAGALRDTIKAWRREQARRHE